MPSMEDQIQARFDAWDRLSPAEQQDLILDEIAERIEKTICPTFSMPGGVQPDQGRITRQDYEELMRMARRHPSADKIALLLSEDARPSLDNIPYLAVKIAEGIESGDLLQTT